MNNKHYGKFATAPMGRRTFMALSSAAMLAPVTSRAGLGNLSPQPTRHEVNTLPVSNSQQVNNVSIGYWTGGQVLPSSDEQTTLVNNALVEEEVSALLEADEMDLLQDMKEALSSQVINAETVSPDTSLQNRNVQITIHTMTPAKPDTSRSHLSEWLLDTLYQVSANGENIEVPFHAWSYNDDQRTDADSISFTAPVHASRGLSFKSTRTVKRNDDLMLRLLNTALTGKRAVNEQCNTTTCNLSANSSTSGPKLRQGIYLIAGPDYRNAKLPQWDQYVFIDNGDDSVRRLYRKTLTGLIAADFDYITVTISAA